MAAGSSRKLEKSDVDSINSIVKTEERWTWIIVALCFSFAVVIVVIVVISLEYTPDDWPDDVDVVLYQSPETSRMTRYVPQSKAVWKFMSWVRRVFVLSEFASPGYDQTLGVHFVRFTGSNSQGFEYMPDIPEIADHAIYLSDMTVPFRPVKKNYMFYQSRPRMFNVFREQSEVNFFASYLELPTMPVLCTNLVKLKEPPQTWQDLVFREVTEERLVNREDMNRDIFVVSTMPANVQTQFDKLVSVPPIFATFHINPDAPDPELANTTLAAFLIKQFP